MFSTPEIVEICQVLQEEMIFLMQNHFVKKRETLLYSTHKKIITILPKHFQILHYNM
jgi:hypothetical protein